MLTHIFLGCCYLLNSAMNPFLYSIFSKRFRRGFFDLLQRMDIRYFKQNRNDRPANATTTRGNNRPFNQVINHRAMLRHFDLKSLNGNSKSNVAKKVELNVKSKPKSNHEEINTKTTKTQSLCCVNDNVATPSRVLYSEPHLGQPKSHNVNEIKPLKKYETSVNLKPERKPNSFCLTQTLVDKSLEYETIKNGASKEKHKNYIYKVVFSGSPNP